MKKLFPWKNTKNSHKKASRIKGPTKKEYVTFPRQTKKATKLFPGKNANIFVKKGYLELKKMSREKEVCGTHTLTWSAR